MKSVLYLSALAATVMADDPWPAAQVCVANSAGYVLDFYLKDQRTGNRSHESDSYAAGHTNCMDVEY